MNSRILSILFVIVVSTFAITAQSWLDRPLTRNWNTAGANVPTPPRNVAPMDPRCREQARTPDSVADRELSRMGWMLFGPSQSFGATTVIMAMAAADGQCRPDQYNAFVFVSNRFAGTLAPRPMTSRTDGALDRTFLSSATNVSAEFRRYSSTDAMCCPSQVSSVFYTISGGVRPLVTADTVNTAQSCPGTTPETQTAVTGTVTYRQRSGLPPTAVVSVKLLDVSLQDVAAGVISEDRIPTEGKQVPFAFDLPYDPAKIQERNRYAVRAEIRDGERLLFTTDTSYPVITQGNPTSGVEIVVVPVGGGGGGGGGGNTVTGQSITLQSAGSGTLTIGTRPPWNLTNARVTVRPNGNADVTLTRDNGMTTHFGGRLVSYNTSNLRIRVQNSGDADAGGEIVVNYNAQTLNSITSNNLTLDGQNSTLRFQAGSSETPVTGQSISLSKIGLGTMQIEGRNTWPLIRATVTVRPNADADVALFRVGGSTVFSGKLIMLDPDRMRIMVQNSGNADASGELIVDYNGRTLNSISSRNLMLDGQNVTVRF